jgi:REP element-mobilizing transposase RayT
MPDHLHFFVALDEDVVTLSAFTKSLKNALSKAMRTSGIPAPHWQKGFFEHVLRSSESYAEKWQYVRDKPVRGGYTTIRGKHGRLKARSTRSTFGGHRPPLHAQCPASTRRMTPTL